MKDTIIIVTIVLLIGLLCGVIGFGAGRVTYTPQVIFKEKIVVEEYNESEHYNSCFKLVKESREFTKELWEMDING